MKTTALYVSNIFVNVFLFFGWVDLILSPIGYIGLAIGNDYLIEAGIKSPFTVDFTVNSTSGIVKIILITLFSIFNSIVVIYLMRVLKKMLKSFETKFTFNNEVFSSLKKMRNGLIFYFISVVLENFISNIVLIGHAKLSLPIGFIVIIFIIFQILIEIFKHGLKIQEEQDLTV